MDDLIRRTGVNLGGPDTTPDTNQAEQKVQSFSKTPEGILDSQDVIENAVEGGGGIGFDPGGGLGAIGGPIIGTSQLSIQFDSSLKILESEGKLGNKELQTLTSNFNQAESVRTEVFGKLSNFETQNKLGNFEIQDLMSRFIQGAFSDALKELESQDKLGNFEIQDLMSNYNQAETLRKTFEDTLKDLESQDRLGNFEIQNLMSTYNQSETLASNVQQRTDNTVSGQQQKIG